VGWGIGRSGGAGGKGVVGSVTLHGEWRGWDGSGWEVNAGPSFDNFVLSRHF